jgi:hypothetical protein
MKRTTLIVGVIAVMAAMLVALAAPAMAKDNDGKGKNDRHHNNNNGNNHNGGNNHFDNRLDRIDNRVDNQLDRIDNRFDNHHDNWFDNDRDDVNIRYVSDGDDFDGFYPYWGWYGGCGFDWDGPVILADCWD